MHSDPTLANRKSASLESASSETISNAYISEESLKDTCSVHSSLEQEVGDNYVKRSDEHSTIKYSSHPNSEKAADTDSTGLNTDQEVQMNGTHKTLERINIVSNGHGKEPNDLQKSVDNITKIATLSHSDPKQEMAGHRNVVRCSALNSKSEAVSSQISDSISCDTEAAVLGPQDLNVTERVPVISETSPHSSPESLIQ
jgi:hypothetical protein